MSNIIQIESEKIVESIDFSKLKNTRILITGSSGLVGVFLISSLQKIQKELNVEVHAWVNSELPDYLTQCFNYCKIIKGDITNESTFNGLPQFDYIIHAAGYAQPVKFVKNKAKTIQINTTATNNLFNILKPTGTFVFISSSEIYNGIEQENIKEEMIGNTNTDNSRACYIESKRCGEAICYAYLEQGYNIKIARLCLAYGPGTRVDDERAVSSFIKNGIQKPVIRLLDGGESIRTYCYITDAVEMIWNITLNSKKVVYNVGGESHISILGLARMIGEYLNKQVVIPEVLTPLKGNPKIVNIDCQRYRDEFNKSQYIPFEKGIKQAIEWYKSILT